MNNDHDRCESHSQPDLSDVILAAMIQFHARQQQQQQHIPTKLIQAHQWAAITRILSL